MCKGKQVCNNGPWAVQVRLAAIVGRVCRYKYPSNSGPRGTGVDIKFRQLGMTQCRLAGESTGDAGGGEELKYLSYPQKK